MAKNGYKVLDSDIHVLEPADLWQRYIDEEFKDRAPRGLTEFVGDIRMVDPDGNHWGRTHAAVSEHSVRTSRTHTKYQEQFRAYAERGWTSDVELEGMDIEGIDVAVVFPSRGLYALSIPNMDSRLAAAVARAYNNWLHDFCEAEPTRLLGCGMISAFSVEDAVSEAQRCVNELGFKGVFLRPNEVNERNWHDAYYDPLWSALEELNIPLGFHEAQGSALPQVGDQFGTNSMLRHIICHPGEQMLAVISMCAGGVLERHPRLRVGFLEGNCSWLPFLLWRMDDHWEREGEVYSPELTMSPSKYFKRQCLSHVEPDEEPVKYVIDYMGNDHLMFSTDFPHNDSAFPYSVETFLKLPITDEDKRKILWDNCAHYYGIE